MEIGLVVPILAGGLLVLLATGIPVAFALLVAGIAAFFAAEGFAGLQFVGALPWSKGASFIIMAIPMFVYVGFLLQRSGMVEAIFRMLNNWFGRVPGSLGVVSIMGAAVFSSMSGSGSATAATLGLVTKPEADRYGFDRKLILGCLNGGANLAPLIPPSIALIVYSTLTEQPITRLFAAGVIPGVMMAAIMIVYVMGVAIWKPHLAPRSAPVSWKEKFKSLQVIPLAGTVVFLMLGGIFLGWFTPTEGAAIGVLVSYAVILIYQKFNLKRFIVTTWQGSREAAAVSAFVMLLVVAGFIYSQVLTFFAVPQTVAEALIDAGIARYQFLIILVVLMLVLGMFVDGLTMQVITVPFMLPLLIQFDIDLIWFGIFVVVFVEIGTLTPPFGIHMFILQGVMGVSYGDVVKGSAPFILVWLFGVLLLILFPALATWLPGKIV